MFQTHFERIGGSEKIQALVDAFYGHMDELPEVYGIRKMHAEDLAGSRQKLYDFLNGWMGGPPLYTDKYGHPMLRRRHLHFGIGDAERDQWLMCMKLALADVVESEPLRDELYAAFVKVADHMRNQAGHNQHP
jgi:hemoglobin